MTAVQDPPYLPDVYKVGPETVAKLVNITSRTPNFTMVYAT